VFHAGEAFFLGGEEDFTVAKKAGGAVVIESRDTKYVHISPVFRAQNIPYFCCQYRQISRIWAIYSLRENAKNVEFRSSL
jgi:hypothetical protein